MQSSRQVLYQMQKKLEVLPKRLLVIEKHETLQKCDIWVFPLALKVFADFF